MSSKKSNDHKKVDQSKKSGAKVKKAIIISPSHVGDTYHIA